MAGSDELEAASLAPQASLQYFVIVETPAQLAHQTRIVLDDKYLSTLLAHLCPLWFRPAIRIASNGATTVRTMAGITDHFATRFRVY